LKKRDAIIAKLATLERHWTTYIPSPTAVWMLNAVDLIVLKKF
jgi:hypothetical protein